MAKYFNECTIDEMFEYKDWYYERSDDHRAYKNGIAQSKLIREKIEELGGWSDDLIKSHNKYAPESLQMKYK